MFPPLVYEKFLLEINKGNTQYNVACDKARFVLIFNKEKHTWVNENLKNKDSVLIDNLREIVASSELLNPVVKDSFVSFNTEIDFYEPILVKALCEKDDCKRTIFSREVKNQNRNIFEFDENQKPDFDYEWTFHSFQDKTLNIYKTDFKVISAEFEYYKVLPEFDIEGYMKIDDVASENKELPLSDQYIDQIIDYAATEFMRNYKDSLGFQLAKEREKN